MATPAPESAGWLATEEPLVVARVLRDQPRLCSMLTRDPRLAGALLSEPAELLRWDGRTLLRSLGYDGITLPAVAQRAIAALSVDQVANLLSWFGHGPGRASLLRALPVQVRRQVVELAHPGERLNATITAGELRELPASDRIELARRILAEGSSERSWRHLEITGVLPYDEAAAPLLEATSSHRYQERRVAWATLLTCAVAEHDPHAFTDALSAAKRAWHDQDVVRAAALRPVADAPARLLSAVPLEVVREAVVATVESRDATRETFALVSRWLARSLTSALARGLAQRVTTLQGLAARLHADPRSPGRFSAQHQMTAGPQLWAELRERVLHDARGSRYSAALRVAGLFGTNLASAPELDRLIGEIARTAPNPADAAAAARRWVADPATRDQRVGELVAHDPALGRADVLWQVVSTRRTDLLDRLLETGEPLPAVPPGRRGRWTPTQSAAVEAHAAAVAHGAEAGLRERESAAAFVTEPNTLTSIADTAPQPVAAAALIALGSADPEQALPVLLRHAGGPAGPAARAAVRALGKALDSLPDGLAVERLGPVLTNGSVGAAKEAARLLVDRRPAGAVDELADAWAAARHDDVRAAVAAALVGFLGEDDRVPALVAEAIRSPARVRDVVLAVPPSRLAPGQRPALARILADVLTGDADVPPAVATAYAAWWKHAPDAIDELPRLVSAAAPQELFQAVSALVAHRHRALSALVDRLVTDITAGDPTAWHRLAELAAHQTYTSIPEPDIERETTRCRTLINACRVVGMHAATVPLLRHLASLSLDGPPDFAIWDELIAAVDERPHRWRDQSWQVTRVPQDPDAVLAVVDHLIGRVGSVPGLLAGQLLTATVRGTGWTPACAERLEALRRHPDPDVREAARSIRTAYR
ncbi:hypothetical protein AB0L13_39420 [Saccharopolyspora shandongensis]|uniref:hypothetical protein n=1 Tax=Saccharopolyspora shandongensis TaxID=418495 RepID=UPI00343EC5C0